MTYGTRGSVTRSQVLSNNPYHFNTIPRVDTHFFKIYSNNVVALPRDIFPGDLPVKILKALIPFSTE